MKKEHYTHVKISNIRNDNQYLIEAKKFFRCNSLINFINEKSNIKTNNILNDYIELLNFFKSIHKSKIAFYNDNIEYNNIISIESYKLTYWLDLINMLQIFCDTYYSNYYISCTQVKIKTTKYLNDCQSFIELLTNRKK